MISPSRLGIEKHLVSGVARTFVSREMFEFFQPPNLLLDIFHLPFQETFCNFKKLGLFRVLSISNYSRPIMETLDLRVDEFAQEIASWESARQETFLQKLVDLNYRRGLKALSEKIQERLIAEGKLHQSVDEIFAELARVREAVAADDYPR
jgi:hypothetical protein